MDKQFERRARELIKLIHNCNNETLSQAGYALQVVYAMAAMNDAAAWQREQDAKQADDHAKLFTKGSGSWCTATSIGTYIRNAESKQETRPDYYYKGGMTTYTDRDPEVTCRSCKRTFRCDAMDACCRLCGSRFANQEGKADGQ